MQLDLFCDNRRTIRLNDADELLRDLRLEEALAVYGELLASLESEDHDLGEANLPAWLPVWGWLQGAFRLPLSELMADCAPFVAALETAHSFRSLPAARLWFDDLRYAKYLRTVFRDDRELVRVRRRMRQLNGFLFDRYMEKIRGTPGEI